MSAAHTSQDLLAHFDGPATPVIKLQSPKRGVRWVLLWAAALGTLLFAVVVLAQFGYCLTWEQALARAARAAALEATLPRATRQTVEQTLKRKLPSQVANRLQFSLLQNGVPVRGLIHAAEGDRLVVTLGIPAHDILPRWLSAVAPWQTDSQILARAQRQLPGRSLRGR